MESSYKEIAREFLQLAGMGEAQKAFDTMVSSDFLHHNQHYAGDRQSLLHAMQEDHAKNPNISLSVKQCFAEGDHVITHSYVRKKHMEIVVVHIFRFNATGKIAELWDLGEIIQPHSPNNNGMF